MVGELLVGTHFQFGCS